ncbi:MAG: hypothetical protein LBM87_02055 [Ruminococcus sp.]|nr:hypothetical protein [Ruminococcus sp.]
MKQPTPQVIIHELNSLKNYTFTVIFALEGKVSGQWLYCRHKNRETWETAGAHLHIHLFPRYLDDDFPSAPIDYRETEPAPYEDYKEYLWLLNR